MAGDWIKMRTNLWDHPKVVRIVSAICPQNVRDMSERCRIVGALFRTWALADAFTEDGILDGYDAEALDVAVGIEGWSANLQHVGWLIVEPQRLVVPRFDEHNGASAKRRAEDSSRKRKARDASAKCPQNVRKMSAKLRTREEKRREENNNSYGVCAEQSSAPPPPTAHAVQDGQPSPFTFPVKGKGRKSWNLPQRELERYQEAYDGLDVACEMRKAIRWCETNPRRQKTATGMLTFLTKWLSKAQNGPRPAPALVHASKIATDEELENYSPHEEF